MLITKPTLVNQSGRDLHAKEALSNKVAQSG